MEIKIRANVQWKHIRDGKIIAQGEKHNLILEDGYEIIVDVLGGIGAQPSLLCIAIGDSATDVSGVQTDLQGAELSFGASTNARVVHTLRCYREFVAGVGTGTIRESVIADTNAAKGARKCAARVVIGPIVKAIGDAVIIVWDFEVEVI